MSDTSAGAQAPQPSGLAGRQILDAVKDNFVVVSGVAVWFGTGSGLQSKSNYQADL